MSHKRVKRANDVYTSLILLMLSSCQISMSVELVLHHVLQILTVSILMVVMTVFAELALTVMESLSA